METISTLAPFTMSWIMFMASRSMMTMLVALLMSSLTLPLMFMEFYKVFWPCGLLLILMSTGLIVIFAYIVSLHESKSELIKGGKSLLLMCLFLLPIFLWPSEILSKSFCFMDLSIKVDVLLSLVLIFILLFLVINFVRLVYSKGGGFRKKF